MKELATRDADKDGKLQWSLVDFKALEPMVKVLMYGANKYSADNWKKGLGYRQICESLIRHTIDFLDGEDIDDPSKGGSGLPHIGHIECNALFLAFMVLNRPEMDDRGKERIGTQSKKENQ